MHLLVGGLLLSMGIVALAVVAVGVRSGRVWHVRRGLLGRASGWVSRSREPVQFWIRVVSLAISGCSGVGVGVYILVWRPPLRGRR